ncbi:MAG: putative DNA binding domain-containing protein [Methanosarcinales archaeon]|nr:putative DNA binding domain-containing protein [Methanosarcinales archaeon]
MNLNEIIGSGESEITEFKTSLAEWRDVVETISAFSNRSGGRVLIGVADDCGIVGVDIGKNTIEKLTNQIKQNTDPVTYPSIRVEEIGGKQVIVVDALESKQKPVLAFGRAVIRVGKSNQKLGYEGIRNLTLKTSKVYWDGLVCEGAGPEDIDEEKVMRYLERREEIRKVSKPEKMDMKTLLLNIGAAKKMNGETKPTNAGILFFGKNPQRFVLQSQLRTARFAGRTLTRDFLDRLDCSGALWELVGQAEDFVRKNIRLFGFRTEYSFQRIDKLEYPIKAVREAIINALIHRNYSEPADTRVAIFDDRIEIISPGSFPKGVTPEKPKHVPVNPVLCQLMYDIGFIEKYGSGIYMINELCDEWGILKPEYELSEVETTVSFRSGGKAIVIGEIEKIGVELNERQREGLKIVFKKGKIANADYAKMFGISRNTATNDLTELVEKGLIKRVGRGRGSYYTPKI